MRAAWCWIVVLMVLAGPAAAAFEPAAYPRRHPVMDGVVLHWRVDGTASARRVTFALSVPTTTGWVGFGVGEPNSGSMPGADIAIATVDASTGSLTVGDYYALAFDTPVRDCEQPSDWTAIGATRANGTTVVEFSRMLTVHDEKQDRAIVDDGNPTRLLVAYGSTQALSYHGRTQRKMFSLELFSALDPLALLRSQPDVRVLRWGLDRFRVPAQETYYAHSPCVGAPPGASAEAAPHIVGFNAVVQENTTENVHHIVVRAFARANCVGVPIDLWAVASSHVPFVLPIDIGLPMIYASYNIQVHFDNPNLLSTLVDSSGVDVFYTLVPRSNAAGVLQLGDPFVSSGVTLSDGTTAAEYTCPGACTRQWETDITVFGELLHMHGKGAAFETRFVGADGRLLRRSTAEYYSFHAQQNTLLTPRLALPRGSSTTTRCTYQVPSGQTVRFGLASDEEMCIHFMYYYPLQTNTMMGARCGFFACGTVNGPFRSDSLNVDLHRSFNGTCPLANGDVAAPPLDTLPTSVTPPPSPTSEAHMFSVLVAVAASCGAILLGAAL